MYLLTDETYSDTNECRLLVTHFCQHLSCGDTHEQVGKEVHKVTHDAKHVGTADLRLILPNYTNGSTKIRDKRDHGI